jgi:hypothetical protein
MKKNIERGFEMLGIGIGVWILYGAFSNIIEYPQAFFGGGDDIEADGNYDSTIAVYTILFAGGGVGLVLYGIRKIKETFSTQLSPSETMKRG